MLGREDYIPAVGFGVEPRERRWLWVRRIGLFIFIVFLAFLLLVGVIFPDSRDNQSPGRVQTSPLPAPR